jgi:hypothetical protein
VVRRRPTVRSATGPWSEKEFEHSKIHGPFLFREPSRPGSGQDRASGGIYVPSHRKWVQPQKLGRCEEDLPDLADGVEDQHVAGGQVGPPPAQHGVQDQAQQDRGSQDPVDQRDLALGPQDGIAECAACLGLTGGQRETSPLR